MASRTPTRRRNDEDRPWTLTGGTGLYNAILSDSNGKTIPRRTLGILSAKRGLGALRAEPQGRVRPYPDINRREHGLDKFISPEE